MEQGVLFGLEDLKDPVPVAILEKGAVRFRASAGEAQSEPLGNREGMARALAELHPLLDLRAAEEALGIGGRDRFLETLAQEGVTNGEGLTLAFLLSDGGMDVRSAKRVASWIGKVGWGCLVEDPYRTQREVEGVGFKVADRLAKRLGAADPVRRRAGAVERVFLESRRVGETWVGEKATKSRVHRLLGDGAEAELAISEALGQERIFRAGRGFTDSNIGRLIQRVRDLGESGLKVEHGPPAPSDRPEGPDESDGGRIVFASPGLQPADCLLDAGAAAAAEGAVLHLAGDPYHVRGVADPGACEALLGLSGIRPEDGLSPLSHREWDLRPGRREWGYAVHVDSGMVGDDGFPLTTEAATQKERALILERVRSAMRHFFSKGIRSSIVVLRTGGPLGKWAVEDALGDDLEAMGGSVEIGPWEGRDNRARLVLWHISDQRHFRWRLLRTLLSLPVGHRALFTTRESLDFCFTAGVARDRDARRWMDFIRD